MIKKNTYVFFTFFSISVTFLFVYRNATTKQPTFCSSVHITKYKYQSITLSVHLYTCWNTEKRSIINVNYPPFQKIVGAASSSGEGQLIIRTCSRFVYENQSLKEQQFLAVLDIVSICCQHHHQHLIADPFFHLRSMHYIFLLAVRRKVSCVR